MMRVVGVDNIILWNKNNGTIPQMNEYDQIENKLANLFEYYRKLENDDTRLLDENIPYWRKKTTVKAYNNSINLIKFYNENNRFPAQIRPVNRERTSEEDNEYKLACWLNGLKQNNIKNRFVKELLDRECPEWKERNNPETNAIKQANKLYMFWKENNRLPKQINKINKIEQEETEYRLATWLNSQKQSIKGNNKLYIYPDVLDILHKIPILNI